MTTANKITIGRILAVPFFIVFVLSYLDEGNEVFRLLALLSFAIASFSDGLDGYLARRYRQRSELGAILDPLADKLLLVSGVVLLCLRNPGYLERLPLWLVAAIISRDLLVLIGLCVIYYSLGKVKIRPRLSGKFSTVFQMACVLWVLLKWPAAGLNALVWCAGIGTALSGILYVMDGVRQLAESPRSRAEKKSGLDS